MTALTATHGTGGGIALGQGLTSRWLWCLAAVLIYALPGLSSTVAGLAASLGDTDDALRLVQVRAWLGGAGWYDTTLAQIGGASPLVSHWSRLIDVPLALLSGLFGSFLSLGNAETAMRLVWPLLTLLVFLRVLVREAEARGGTVAALLVLALALTCMTGLYQFRPGRIDHHNVMIAATVGGLLLLARSLDTPRRAYIGGAALGLALAVGYEPLALIVPALGLLVLAAALHAPWLASARNALLGLSAILLLAFVATTPSARWLTVSCDALALNLVLLVGVCAVGLALVQRWGHRVGPMLRLSVLALVGLMALLAAWAVEPACAGGPFGTLSADATRLWFVHVAEGKSLWRMKPEAAGWAWTMVLLMAAGVGAAVQRWRRMRDADSAALLAVMGCAVPAAAYMMKFHPYASFIAVFCIALEVSTWRGNAQIGARSAQIAGFSLLNPWSLAMLATLVVTWTGVAETKRDARPAPTNTEACYDTTAVRALAQLPAGSIVAPVNLGPYITALTPHSVLSGPYHRLDSQIVETFAIFASAAPEAERRLDTLLPRYVVHCPGAMRYGDAAAPADSLQTILERGEIPVFLERIPLAGTPLMVFRLRPERRP